ncbi:(2,3-dihydroxybenzoyl)adenylate synthase [Psychromonas sp.]|uniref:(2,3-dihydroxybenzoyl)adenylate synthase n=1 Tax=Psychromonas sp. TaxID=1884585 RepID=UPI003A9697C1
MTIQFTAWPEKFANDYVKKGYWNHQPLTHIIEGNLTDNGHKTAIICNNRSFTYHQVEALSNQLAAEIALRGIPAGSTALVQLPNSAEFYIVYFALLKCGIAAVNALFNHSSHELMAFAQQLNPALYILSTEHPLLESQDQQTTLLAKLAQYGTENCEALLVSPVIAASSNNSVTADMRWLDEQPALLLNGKHADKINQHTAADQVAFFQLSGGSTGTPKLIPRTHNDYYYSIRQSAVVCQLSSDCIYLCALPAPHNFTLSSPGALGVFFAGGTVVTAPDPSPTTCFALIKQHQVNMTSLVPPALHLWINAVTDTHSSQALASLNLIQVGGSKLSVTIAEKVSVVLGCKLQQVFGMAEGLVNYTHFTDNQWHITHTQGKPMSPCDEIKILDESGNPVKQGEVGALWTRGPYTFRGYYNAPIANSRAFDEHGFYCSGDLVQQTETGYLIVMGRNKDQINRGGEKIDAQEVEELMLQLPAISDVALVAMEDPVLGERSCAYIINKSTIKARDVRRFLREQGVASYKIPDRITFVDNLPKTAVGKIDKRALRELTSLQLTE